MTTQNLDREIRFRIDSFLTDLAGLVKRSALESVQDALGGSAAPARRGPGRPPRAARRGAKRSQSALAGLSSRLLDHVKKHPGQGVTRIAAALRTSSQDLQLPVRKLLAARKLRTKGKKRGTKYFAR
jgi:hypothetical protein